MGKQEEEAVATKYKIQRSFLEGEKKRLSDELAQIKASAAPTEARREGSPFGKREEEATESLELERRIALEKQVKDQLADIEHALAKFDNDTYGLCEECGKPIDPARLEVRPQAKLCVNCMSLKAKNAKGKFSTS